MSKLIWAIVIIAVIVIGFYALSPQKTKPTNTMPPQKVVPTPTKTQRIVNVLYTPTPTPATELLMGEPEGSKTTDPQQMQINRTKTLDVINECMRGKGDISTCAKCGILLDPNDATYMRRLSNVTCVFV